MRISDWSSDVCSSDLKIEAANFANDASTTDFAFDTVGRPTRTLYNGFYDPATGTVESADAANRFRPEAAITYDAPGNAVRFGTRSGVNAFEHTWRTYASQGQESGRATCRERGGQYV